MIVVSDTTPLISLIKIKRLDILSSLFGNVLIPQTVFDELTGDMRFEEEANWIINSKYIMVREVINKESVNILRRATGLD